MFKKKDSNIVVISKPGKYECGGTDATLDRSAPKEIESEDMVFFSVASALGFISSPDSDNGERFSDISYISAFASKCDGGAFLFLHTGASRYAENDSYAFSLTKEDIFPCLDRIVRKYDFAKQNGFCSRTHGLPENFGGDVDIRYSSGEKIYFADNQSPVISLAAAKEIANLFFERLNRADIGLPDLSALKEIRFEEKRNDGFTAATLTLSPDGTGVNKKTSQYEGGKIFKSEKPVDGETVLAIKGKIKDCGLTLWRFLPKSDFCRENGKTLTFVFENGEEITAADDRNVPHKLGGGFFDVELEMTTKH